MAIVLQLAQSDFRGRKSNGVFPAKIPDYALHYARGK